MAVQMAEGLLAVIWLDRCRQTQRLTQGHGQGYREEVVRTLLASFIAEQRWGLAMQVATEDGVEQPGVLNFDPSNWTDEEHDYDLEMCIFGNIVTDIERGDWHHIEHYMRRAEFFHDLPRNSIRRLPPGAPSR